MKYVLLLTLLFSGLTHASEQVKSINFVQEGDVSKFIIKVSGDTLVNKKDIKEDKMILLDLKNTTATKRVLRPIDTSEFKSSVTYISGYQSPTNKNDIRFTINLRDNVRSKIEQNGDRIVVSIENRFGVFDKISDKAKKDKVTGKLTDKDGNFINQSNLNVPKSDSVTDILENLVLSGPKKYVGKKISLNVRDMPVTELLQIISEVSGFNIIVGKDVQAAPALTLSLTETPWDEALDTILKLSKLVAQKHSNILVVDTLTNFTRQKEQELKEKQLSQKQEPLVTKVFPISYSKLDDLIKILRDYSTDKRGKITKDERTNNIIVQDTVEVIERMKRIVELLDTQTPQVLIEAKIVEAEETFAKKIGLKNGIELGWDAGSSANSPAFTLNSAPYNSSSDATSAVFAADLTTSNISPLSLSKLLFNLELMEFNQEAKIISSPKVITENKQKAKITSADTRRLIVQNIQPAAAGGAGAQVPPATDVEEVEAALELEVTPNITNDGSIALQVKINKTGFSSNDTSTLDTNSRTLETNTLVDNGSTVVLGGIYQTQERQSQSGIPVLKDLPLLGWLFRSSYNPETRKVELIVFITPRIINQEEAGLTGRLETVPNGEEEKSVKQ